jgi:hypothetical protein
MSTELASHDTSWHVNPNDDPCSHMHTTCNRLSALIGTIEAVVYKGAGDTYGLEWWSGVYTVHEEL